MSLDVKKVLEDNNVTLDEVLEWGKKRYPSYIGNMKALVTLYLKQKGINVIGKKGTLLSRADVPMIEKFSEAKIGGKYQIKALLLEELENWSFKYCPNCKKTVKGKVEVCPDCGKATIDKYGWRYLFADEEGTFTVVQFSLNPKDELKEGEYVLRGRVVDEASVNKNLERGEKVLVIFDYESVEETEKESIKKLRTFFTISPRTKVVDLQEFIRNEKIGMTVEEVCQKIGAKIEGDEVVKI